MEIEPPPPGSPEAAYFSEERLPGSWLCIPRELLQADSEGYYRFELIGLEVRESGEPDAPVIARVTDCFDSGAHGVIVTRMFSESDSDTETNSEKDEVSEIGRDVLIPLLDKFAEVDLINKVIIIKDYRDFIP